jgi:hypothetical protein
MSQIPPENSNSQQPDANSTQQADSSAPQNVVKGNQNRVIQGDENQSVLGDNNTVVQGNIKNSLIQKSQVQLGQVNGDLLQIQGDINQVIINQGNSHEYRDAFIDMLFSAISVGRNIRNSQNAEKKEYFEKMIEPLYLELQTLHEYYLNLFRETGDYLENGNSNLNKILISFNKEIEFNGTKRINVEKQLSILITANKEVKNINNSSFTDFLQSLINYLTCPKTVRFLIKDFIINAEGEEDPFKLGIMAIIPSDLLYVSASVKFDEDYRDSKLDSRELASIRHLFRWHILSLMKTKSKFNIHRFLFFNKVAKREVLEAVYFLVEELNINYEKATNFFYVLKQELFS